MNIADALVTRSIGDNEIIIRQVCSNINQLFNYIDFISHLLMYIRTSIAFYNDKSSWPNSAQ